MSWSFVPLRRWVTCLDGGRIPLNAAERAEMFGAVPYWGANGIVDFVSGSLFDERLVLLGEDGAPFFDKSKPVAFVSEGPVWPNNHIHVLRPNRDIDARFLTYALNVQDYAAVISGSTRDKLTQADMSGMLLPAPPLASQRAIADFLDAEVSRIDEVHAARSQQAELLRGRFWTLVGHLTKDGTPTALRRCFTRLADGPFGSAFSSDEYVDAGVAVVRLGNIGFAEYLHEAQAFVPSDFVVRFARHSIHAGDLLIAGLGDESNHAGRACVAPDLGPAIVKGKCFTATIDDLVADAHFLALAMSSPQGAEVFRAAAQGSTRSMINLQLVKSAILALPAVDDQRSVARRMRYERAKVEHVLNCLEQGVALLNDRRQALITAAVTGQPNLAHSIAEEVS